MSDMVRDAVTQTMQDARQQGGTEQGGSSPLPLSAQAASVNGGAANDGGRGSAHSSVTTIPTGGVTWGKKSAWMEMPGEYAGMKIRVWVNYPNDFDSQIGSRDQKIIRDAVKQIFLEHNGWVTPEEYEKAQSEGRSPVPMQQPTTDEFWELIPNDLAGALLLLLNRETLKLPKSLMEESKTWMNGPSQ